MHPCAQCGADPQLSLLGDRLMLIAYCPACNRGVADVNEAEVARRWDAVQRAIRRPRRAHSKEVTTCG